MKGKFYMQVVGVVYEIAFRLSCLIQLSSGGSFQLGGVVVRGEIREK